MRITPEQIAELRGDYDHCFACGSANPIGLHLDGFQVVEGVDRDEVQAEWTPRLEYRGFATALHGGIVATALDEICAWSGIFFEGVLSVTANLEIKYRRPAEPGGSFTLAGWVVDRSGSRMRLAGELRQYLPSQQSTKQGEPDGYRVVAAATGAYLVSQQVVGELSNEVGEDA